MKWENSCFFFAALRVMRVVFVPNFVVKGLVNGEN